MTIGVTGATGNVGSRVAQLLAQAGERPRVLVRDPSKLAPGLAGAVDPHPGDLRDREYVRSAVTGLDALLWVTPEDIMAADPLAEMATVAGHGAAAVRAAGVPRVVVISSVGAERRHGAGFIDGLARAEEEFTATGADVTILRNGYYFTNLLGNLDELREGRLTTTMPADRPMPWVDPRDVGEVAAARLLASGWSGTVVQAVHGPADLSWADVAAVIAAGTGTKVSVNVISDREMADGLRQAGLAEPAVAALIGMTAGTRDDFQPEQSRTAVSTTPTTLAEWVAGTLGPMLRG